MPLRRSDLADFTYFLEIAKQRNFRRAGLELGISASALSHALRGLEERLGVRLLNRTSRSITLTAASDELRTAVLEPFGEIGRAVDVLNRFREAPVGPIRLSVPTEAADFVVGPILPLFLERYPDMEIEISVSNRMIDVIDSGFDAEIRYGGAVPEDMIAQRLAPDFPLGCRCRSGPRGNAGVAERRRLWGGPHRQPEDHPQPMHRRHDRGYWDGAHGAFGRRRPQRADHQRQLCGIRGSGSRRRTASDGCALRGGA